MQQRIRPMQGRHRSMHARDAAAARLTLQLGSTPSFLKAPRMAIRAPHAHDCFGRPGRDRAPISPALSMAMWGKAKNT